MRDVDSHGEGFEDTDDQSPNAAAYGDLLTALAEIVLSGHAVVLSSPLEPFVARACQAVEHLRAHGGVGPYALDTVAAVLDEVEFVLERSGPSLGGWAQPLQEAREQLVTLRELEHWQRSCR